MIKALVIRFMIRSYVWNVFRNKDLIRKKQVKGKEVVIMGKTKYKQNCFAILNSDQF